MELVDLLARQLRQDAAAARHTGDLLRPRFSPDGKRLALTISEGSNYRKLRKLVDRWVTLGMELSRLRLQEQREASPGATKRRRQSQLSEENKA
ncbi:MAG: hypothetical protein DMG09_17270 [Acidobacteria bacterium]|nr:MAG: hypothetical protein DMG09_17270 [Acidobacteriota bacterium]